MMIDRKSFWKIGLIVAATVLVLLYIGIAIVAQGNLVAENVLMFIVFSTLAGGIAALLTYFRLKLALVSYLLGFALGFILMFNSFIYDNSGWGDLIGVVSLLMWAAIGLGAGLIIQLAVYLYKRFKK